MLGLIVGSEVLAAGASAAASTGEAPAIIGFSPASGSPGSVVKISVTNFDKHHSTILIGGASVVAYGWRLSGTGHENHGKVVATVPSSATTGKIKIKTPFGNAKSASVFTVS